MEDKKCVFATFVNGELKGFRADTFGTLSLKHPKIYGYSPSQVETIKKNVKLELNKAGTSFMKTLLGIKGATPMNAEEQLLDGGAIIEQVEKAEDERRSWGEIELRVYEIPFGYDEYEEWKMEAFNNNLPEPLETHKFTTIENEN